MRVRLLLVLVWLLAHCGSAQALCVLPLCTCNVATTPVVFPNVNPLAAGPTDGVGSVKVNCGGVAGLAIPYTVKLSAGGGTYTTRKMSSGSNKLDYNLYLDTTYVTPWGDGTGGTVVGSGNIGLDVLGLSPPVTHYVYGRINASQPMAVPGNYTDTITVTVTYQ